MLQSSLSIRVNLSDIQLSKIYVLILNSFVSTTSKFRSFLFLCTYVTTKNLFHNCFFPKTILNFHFTCKIRWKITLNIKLVQHHLSLIHLESSTFNITTEWKKGSQVSMMTKVTSLRMIIFFLFSVKDDDQRKEGRRETK